MKNKDFIDIKIYKYWQDIDKEGKSCPAPMPSKYIIEMICDRVAASKVYLKDKYTDRAPWEYYLSHKDENQFDKDTRITLEAWLHYLADKGFEKSFELLRKEFLEKNDLY